MIRFILGCVLAASLVGPAAIAEDVGWPAAENLGWVKDYVHALEEDIRRDKEFLRKLLERLKKPELPSAVDRIKVDSATARLDENRDKRERILHTMMIVHQLQKIQIQLERAQRPPTQRSTGSDPC